MKINRISIEDFRNIQKMELTLCENANIIYGDNGQGKTNFIEAVWMFTGAKSFRGAKDAQLVRFGESTARLEMEFFGDGRDQLAQLCIDNKRNASLNEIPLKTATDLAGHFCAVVFSPAHLTLIKNGPREKRKFIDEAICQIKPKFIHILSQYARVLDQRNRLLKDAAFTPRLYDTLEIWDARLAGFGAVIIKTRASFLERMKPIAQEAYAGISQEREKLDLAYTSTLECDITAEIPEIEQIILKDLEKHREEDIRARMSNYGPHRDDVEITLDEKSARLYGSQGQQRSCVLALKLAECHMIYETLGEYPVVLLDDVMSELDVSRRDYLLNHLKDRQVIMTCCDKAYFKRLGKGMSVKVKEGEIVYSRYY